MTVVSRVLALFGTALALGMVSGCAEPAADDPAAYCGPGTMLDGTTRTCVAVRATAVIGAEGGQLSLPDGATLTVPPGALTEPVELSIERIDEDDGRWDPTSTTYSMGPSGLEFVRPALVSIPARDGTLANSVMLLSDDDGQNVETLPSEWDGEVLRARVRHFSRIRAVRRGPFPICSLFVASLFDFEGCPHSGNDGLVGWNISEWGPLDRQPFTVVEFGHMDVCTAHVQLLEVRVGPIPGLEDSYNVSWTDDGDQIIGTPPNERSSSGWLLEHLDCIDDTTLPSPWDQHIRHPGWQEFDVWPEDAERVMNYQVCFRYGRLTPPGAGGGYSEVEEQCFEYRGDIGTCPEGTVRAEDSDFVCEAVECALCGDVRCCERPECSDAPLCSTPLDCSDCRNPGCCTTDATCSEDPICEWNDNPCADGVDEIDQDGIIDCADPDCRRADVCPPRTMATFERTVQVCDEAPVVTNCVAPPETFPAENAGSRWNVYEGQLQFGLLMYCGGTYEIRIFGEAHDGTTWDLTDEEALYAFPSPDSGYLTIDPWSLSNPYSVTGTFEWESKNGCVETSIRNGEFRFDFVDPDGEPPSGPPGAEL